MAGMQDVKPGKMIIINDQPHEVVRSEHLMMGRGKGIEKTILKNLITGASFEKSFTESDRVMPADITYANSEYLYHDGESYHFMNTNTYDQFELSQEIIGDDKLFLAEGDKVIIQEFEGTPLNIKLEPSCVLEIEDTPPGEKGDTATGGKKPATLTTGLTIQVPLFLSIGDKIRIDTRTREYLGRV